MIYNILSLADIHSIRTIHKYRI